MITIEEADNGYIIRYETCTDCGNIIFETLDGVICFIETHCRKQNEKTKTKLGEN